MLCNLLKTAAEPALGNLIECSQNIINVICYKAYLHVAETYCYCMLCSTNTSVFKHKNNVLSVKIKSKLNVTLF